MNSPANGITDQIIASTRTIALQPKSTASKSFTVAEVHFTMIDIRNSRRSIKLSISGTSIRTWDFLCSRKSRATWRTTRRRTVVNRKIYSASIWRRKSPRWLTFQRIDFTSFSRSTTIGIQLTNRMFSSNLSSCFLRTKAIKYIFTLLWRIVMLKSIFPNK